MGIWGDRRGVTPPYPHASYVDLVRAMNLRQGHMMDTVYADRDAGDRAQAQGQERPDPVAERYIDRYEEEVTLYIHALNQRYRNLDGRGGRSHEERVAWLVPKFEAEGFRLPGRLRLGYRYPEDHLREWAETLALDLGPLPARVWTEEPGSDTLAEEIEDEWETGSIEILPPEGRPRREGWDPRTGTYEWAEARSHEAPRPSTQEPTRRGAEGERRREEPFPLDPSGVPRRSVLRVRWRGWKARRWYRFSRGF